MKNPASLPGFSYWNLQGEGREADSPTLLY